MGQDFDFQYYRLYSPTLARDLENAVKSDLVSQAGESGKVSLLNNKAHKASPQSDHGLAVIEKLSNEKSNTLEVLSVLCYLHKVGYSEDQVRSKLDDLKPEFKSCFGKAFELAERLFSIKIRALAHS